MGAPELHLSSDAPARRFAVAGESMEFLLRTGDVLYAARGGGPARAGDVVLTMGKDAPVLAHRVLLSVCGRLLTKGDFHFLTDGLAAPEAVVGRVLAVERDGLRVWLDCGWARAAGLGAAGYSLAGALLYRAAQLLLWLAGGLALSLGWTRLQRRLETAHLTAVRAVLRRPAEAVFRALARHTLRRHGGEIDAVLRGLPDAGKDASVVWAAGEIARDTEWSGEVRVSGDVVVLPGAALTLRPGTRVLFLAGKRFHHGVRRRRGGRSVPLTDSRGSHLVVYGRLRVLGEGSAPVFFEASSGPWGGILLLGGEGHELRHAELAVSRGGLSCADEVRLEASDLRFIGTRDCAVRCAGQAGARLERCRFEGGREGLCVEEGARAALAGASFRGVRVAVLARGDAQVSLESCRVDGMGAAGSRGFLFEDEVRGEAKDCETVGCDIGQTLQGRARLALRESRFLKNKIGLACADGSAVSAAKTSFSDNADANVSLAGGEHHLSDCVLQGSAAGLRASGAARLTLEGGRVAGSSGDGLMLAEAAEGRVRAVVFEGNKTAIVLCGRTRLAAEGVRGDKNRGHGLWLQDAASASLQGGGFLGNGDNGIYLTGRSRLELSGGEFQGNRCGLACADESAASAAGTSFSDSREANVSLTGGEHRLEGCSLRGAPVGAGAVGKALLAMTKCAILESREVGLSLAEEAQAKSQADFFAGNRIGIALCGAARLDASGARVEKSAGHGLWLKDSAAASLEGGGFSGNQDNGIYLSGTARLELSQSELKGNRCGLACADESAASAVQTAFAENQETNVSLTGGEHRFVRCAFRGSAAGLSVVDKARVELAGGGISGSSGEGLALAGEAEARSKDAVFDGNRTGIALCGKARLLAEAVRVESSRGHGLWLKDAASASLQGGGFVSNGDNGAYLTGQSRLELLMSEFTGNRCGLACADASAARAVKTAFADNAETNVSLTGGEHRFADCSLRGSAAGLSAVGRARLELEGGSIAASRGAGLALADEAEARARATSFEGNKTGIALCDRARLTAEAASVAGSQGHGLWLKDAASADLSGGEFSGNEDNGIYLTGAARLELAGGELQGNRCGLAGADQSAAAVEKASFADNSECNVSLTGGEHRFAGCSLRGSAAGLSAVGRARVELAGCSIRGSGGKGLALAEDARARLEGGTCEGNAMGMELSGRSRLDARSVRVSGSSGHGLWLKEEASAELAGGDFSHNKDNGVYLTGSARLDLKGGRLEGNRCGLACAEQTAAAAERASFLRNSEVNISLGGGGHRFTDCATQDAPLGLALHGAGRAELDLMRFLRNARGSVLAGDSRAAFKACVWVGNEVGLWVQERSAGSLAGGALRRQKEQALRAGQSASLEARGARFQGNMMAVLLEDDARAAVADCAFRGNPTGVKADGRSRLALKGSRVRGCATDGVWLGAQASGDIAGSVFTANRVAVHYHLDAHINLAHNEFHANVYGDACCYSKCSCPPAGVPGQEAACLKA